MKLIHTLMLGGGILLLVLLAGLRYQAVERMRIPAQALIGTAGDKQVALLVSPLSDGQRTIQVWVNDARGRPAGLSSVSLQFSMPFVCGDIIDIELAATESGYFTRSGAFFGMAGSWFADLSLYDGDSITTTRLVVPIEQPDVATPFHSEQAVSADLLTAGRQLYVTHCAACHGDSGRGDGPRSYALTPRPSDLREHMVPGKHTDEQTYLTIFNGRPQTAMPAWHTTLNSDEIWQLTAYLRSLAAQP